MTAAALLDRRLLFVTGKGGVGKTTVTAALALLASQRPGPSGQEWKNAARVLACEVDAKGNLADYFETRRTAFKPREIQPNLFAMSMDTEASLTEYLHLQLRLPAIARIGPLARIFEFVSTAAPGVREILTVGKLAYEVRERHYGLVVADSSASGHIVGQLTAPRSIDELMKVGPVHEQTGWMSDILADPATTGLVIVTTPEEMPVNETIELVARVREETDVQVAAIVVNRVLPELFSHSDEDVFERLRQPALESAVATAVGGAVAPVLDAARLAVTLRRTRAGHLDRLRAAVPDVPLLFIPYLFTRGHGLRTTSQTAEALSAELGF
ncbi:MAG: ArsA family ATPase [Actinomycetota bacterium]|nr:ArsA family ATPase [Actinomycetota bacterium]